ncbi:CBS domain-containing protein [Sulfurihydrogenibium subterraneum]|uniref:CBS domain-containing protein n=1 Tax=Sulfurihydrogenibium subterraneum TaxID=171121 RepID=UPI00048A6899|nr:CBS domain-containing protein [Sulfurihydrogenibium subterraneum]
MQVVILDEGSDLDAFSSAYGLTLLSPDTYILLPNSYDYKVRKTLDIFQEKVKNKVLKKQDVDFSKVNKAFIVDSQNIPDLDIPIEIFDHHPNKNLKRKNVKIHLYKTGSLSSVIVKKLKKQKIKIDKEDATILALGIYEDTGGFKFLGTTNKDLKAYSYLLNVGLDLIKLKYIVSDTFELEDTEALREIIKNVEALPVENKKVLISYLVKKYNKDTAWILKYVRPFEEADAYFLVVNQKSKKTIIARSKDKDIDVNKIMFQLDGGGHPFAASTTLVGFDYGEIKNFLTYLITGKDKPVSQFIKNDLPVVESDLSLSQVKSIINRFKYVVVLQSGKYAGILTDKTVNNAIKHGLKNEKAITFAQELITVSPSITFLQLLKVVSNYDIGIFPVVEKGFYKGVIYKKNVIKTLAGLNEDKPLFNLPSKVKTVNYSERLKRFFPKYVLDLLKEIGKFSEKLGYRSFIIGGVVRDIVLGKQNLDIDIIVEGSAVELIKKYAKENNLTYHVYPEFMTGNMVFPSGLKLDFATARKEEYDSPGSYPKVEKADLFQDLYRRDFTINTLAIEITYSNFGKLIDYFNGLVDIKEKRIRILHTLSFVEDPIRILRALRFAGRLGFKLENKTENLLKHAVEKDLLNFAPTGRINLELNLTFKEEKVLDILKIMDKYKVLYKLFGITLDREKEKILVKLQDNFLIFKELLNINFPSSNYIYALLSNYPEEIAYNLLKKYHFDKEAKYLNEFLSAFKTIEESQDRYTIYKTLKSFNREFLPALTSFLDSEKFKVIIDLLKKEKNPLIKGEELIKLGLKPSPEFKTILEDVFVKYLNDYFESKEMALSYIKKKYLKEV